MKANSFDELRIDSGMTFAVLLTPIPQSTQTMSLQPVHPKRMICVTSSFRRLHLLESSASDRPLRNPIQCNSICYPAGLDSQMPTFRHACVAEGVRLFVRLRFYLAEGNRELRDHN